MSPAAKAYETARIHLTRARYLLHLARYCASLGDDRGVAKSLAIACDELVEADLARAVARDYRRHARAWEAMMGPNPFFAALRAEQ